MDKKYLIAVFACIAGLGWFGYQRVMGPRYPIIEPDERESIALPPKDASPAEVRKAVRDVDWERFMDGSREADAIMKQVIAQSLADDRKQREIFEREESTRRRLEEEMRAEVEAAVEAGRARDLQRQEEERKAKEEYEARRQAEQEQKAWADARDDELKKIKEGKPLGKSTRRRRRIKIPQMDGSPQPSSRPPGGESR